MNWNGIIIIIIIAIVAFVVYELFIGSRVARTVPSDGNGDGNGGGQGVTPSWAGVPGSTGAAVLIEEYDGFEIYRANGEAGLNDNFGNALAVHNNEYVAYRPEPHYVLWPTADINNLKRLIDTNAGNAWA